MSLRYVTMLAAAKNYRDDLIARGIAQSTIEARVGKQQPHKQTGVTDYHVGHVGRLVGIAGDSTVVRSLDRESVNKLFAESKSAGDYNNMYINVRSFLRYCVSRQYISQNKVNELMENHKTKPYARRGMVYLSLAQYDKALEMAGHPQRRFALVMAWNSLLRDSEIRGMNLEDLHPEDDEIRPYRPKQKMYFTVPVHPGFAREIYQVWLPYYAAEAGFSSWQEMAEEHPDWPLLPRLQMHGRGVVKIVPGRRYESGIAIIAKEALTNLGITAQKGQGMHMWRRSAARCLFNIWSKIEGGNKALLRVSLMLGHKQITTTMIYIGYDQEREELHSVVKDSDPFEAARQATAEAASPNVVSLAARRAKKAQTAI